MGDSCAVNPCQNGGTCIDVFGHFTCTCAPGYGGDTCLEQDTVNDCEHGANPCQHNGVCQDSFFGFSCQCGMYQGVEWGGPTCTQQSGADNCAARPCQNGGNCQNLFVGNEWTFKCTCPANVFGTRCEQVDPVDDCLNFNCCKAGGSCVDLFQSAMCSCNAGFTGTDCSMRTSDMMELTAGECDAGVVPAVTAGGCVMGGF